MKLQRNDKPTHTRAHALFYLGVAGQYGRQQPAHRYSILGGYCEYYWSGHTRQYTFQQWQRIAAFALRYQRFYHYLTEVSPRWSVERTVHYADNSVEEEQRSMTTGAIRRVMVVAPHGDCCF